jgi:flagellar protein FliS
MGGHNMATPASYKNYMAQSVASMTPGEQIVLLFRHASAQIAKAIQCIEKKDINGAHNAIVKAKNIYAYLSDSLDLRYEVSENLFSLYEYAQDRLTEANLKKDSAILEQVLKMTRNFGEMWEQTNAAARTSR